MCRVFGCVASEPVSIRHELLEAENPLIRQSEDHDSGWGMAVYERSDGCEPAIVRFPEAAYADGEFISATTMRGRIFNVHVRRATMGDLQPAEHAPVLALDCYTLGHNGTIVEYPRLRVPRMRAPEGRHGLGVPVQPPDERLRPGGARREPAQGDHARRSSARRSRA